MCFWLDIFKTGVPPNLPHTPYKASKVPPRFLPNSALKLRVWMLKLQAVGARHGVGSVAGPRILRLLHVCPARPRP
jgi:hypothetical protein